MLIWGVARSAQMTSDQRVTVLSPHLCFQTPAEDTKCGLKARFACNDYYLAYHTKIHRFSNF
jgi:hypothetical protein